MPIRDRKRLVAVYPERAIAEGAAHDLRAHGLEPELETPEDEVLSLRSEMQEEARHTVFAAGNIGPFTKEMSYSIVFQVLMYSLLGALIVFPFGFIPIGGVSLGARLLIAVIAGGFAGAVIGFVLGGGFGMKDPSEATMAAERGVTLAVEVPEERTDEALKILDRPKIIRLDQLTADGVPEGTIETEETRAKG